MKHGVDCRVLVVILIAVLGGGFSSLSWTNTASPEETERHNRLAAPVPDALALEDCLRPSPVMGSQTFLSVRATDSRGALTRCARPNESISSWSPQALAGGDDQGAAMAACPQVAASPAPVPWQARILP